MGALSPVYVGVNSPGAHHGGRSGEWRDELRTEEAIIDSR